MQSSATLLRLPLWLGALFTQAKSFRDNPVLGSPALNRLGLHCIRKVVAHALFRVRRTIMAPSISREDRMALERDGFLIKKDFLATEEFDRLVHEIESCRAPLRQCGQGDTLTQRILLDDEALSGMPVCRSLIASGPLLALMRYGGGTLSYPLFFFQRIRRRVHGKGADPQRSLHSDTFHPTVKCWLFLGNVDERNGPFTYVPGSHRLSWRRLAWEYRRSIIGRTLHDGYSEKGSLRATPEDLVELGLPDPVAISVPGNTLIIANTHGFHCRGQAEPGAERTEIYGSLRTNPFNPLPGIDGAWLRRLKYSFVQQHFRKADRREAARGRRPSWHLVEQPPARVSSGRISSKSL